MMLVSPKLLDSAVGCFWAILVPGGDLWYLQAFLPQALLKVRSESLPRQGLFPQVHCIVFWHEFEEAIITVGW